MPFFTFDKDYLDRLRNRDTATERHFVAYFEQLLRIKTTSRSLPADAAEDVRQESFAQVIAAVHREGGVRQPQRFGAFVNSICNNVLLAYYRSSAKNQPMEDSYRDKVLDLEDAPITRQSGERIRRILDGMPKRDRDLLRAIFMEEKEKEAVCQEFGVDRDSLRVLLHRAKDAFRAEYDRDVTQVTAAEKVSSAEQVPGGEQIPTTEQDSSARQPGPNHATIPPGATLYSIAEYICSKKTMEDIVIPLLADLQFEHNEMFSAGREWRAAWVRLRGCWSFFTALGINRVVGLFVRIFLRFSSR